MARGRMLSKSLSTSAKRARLHEVLGPLAEFAQALYPLLIAHSDDFGREAGDPFTVKATIDPSSPRTLAEFERTLHALHDVGLIDWFQSDARAVIQVVDFDEHQSGLHKRTRSKFPESPGTSGNLRGVPAPRARAELERELEPNLTKEKNARASRPPTPRPVENRKPKVPTLAAMVRKDVLPLGLTDEGDLIEAAKRRAAQLHLAYTGSAIRRAIASASGQHHRKRVRA